jgi:hypothetical protein
MKLETFVKDTLVSIAQGVTDANRVFGAPHPFFLGIEPKRHIDFEIALLVEAKTSKDAGGKITVWVAHLHGSAVGSNVDKHVHTVKFSVNAAERPEFFKVKGKR